MKIEKLRHALTVLKHASHDQSTHGRRGRSGGGVGVDIGAKRNVPISPDQTNMFDVLTPSAKPPTPVQPTPTPTPTKPLPTRRGPNEKVIAAHEAEIIKQMPLDEIATPQQKAAFRQLARRIAEFADENDAIREQYLYTTGPDGKLQYDESATSRRGELLKVMDERGTQIFNEINPYIERLNSGDLAMPYDQWEALEFTKKAPMSNIGSVAGVTLLRESMRVRQPGGNTPFEVIQSPATDAKDVKILDKSIGQINKTVKDYVFTPSAEENKPVYLFAITDPTSQYGGYYKDPQPYAQQTVDKQGNIPVNSAGMVLSTVQLDMPQIPKQRRFSTVAIHEYGHHLETKPGVRSYVEKWYRDRAGSDWVDMQLGSTYAAIEAANGPTSSQFSTGMRGIATNASYQRTIYARAYTPNDTNKGLRFSASELTSVNLEMFHAPFITKHTSTDGYDDRIYAGRKYKDHPHLFSAMFAVTQS